MKAKIFGLLLGAALLAGCSLAQPDTGANQPDRLVGALVTTKHIETDVDFTITPSGKVVLDESESRIEGIPVYTEGTDRLERVEFPGVEGYTMILYRYDSKDGSFVSTLADDEFYDLGIHTNVTDEGETNTIRGTLKADVSGNGNVEFYTNPVYQTPEGGFYLVPGSGISTNKESGEGFSMSQSIDEQFTEDFAGKRSLSGSKVEVTFEGGYPGERFTLLQLDGENRVVKQDSWTAEETPDRMVLEPGTTLVVLESHYTDRQGNPQTEAQAIGTGQFDEYEDGATTYIARLTLPGRDSVCQVKLLTLEIP